MQNDKVKSAARVFEILEFFSEHRQPVRMFELSDALGYPLSSLTALLRTMVSLGYMEFDPDTHQYFPAARLSRLTGWMEAGGYEQTVVLDAMHRLRDRAEEPVVLGAPNGLHIEYVISLHRNAGTNSHIRPGTRRLMIQNGIGWLMLGRLPPDEAMQVYRRTIAKGLLTPEYDEATFAATLAAHRDRDISVLDARDLRERTAHWDASMVSALIPVPAGHHRALGIGVHGPTRRIAAKAEFIAGLLRDLVAELDAQLRDGADPEHARK